MSGCRSCSSRLFHIVGPAVAKQQSLNWLRDLLTDVETVGVDTEILSGQLHMSTLIIATIHTSVSWKCTLNIACLCNSSYPLDWFCWATWCLCGNQPLLMCGSHRWSSRSSVKNYRCSRQRHRNVDTGWCLSETKTWSTESPSSRLEGGSCTWWKRTRYGVFVYIYHYLHLFYLPYLLTSRFLLLFFSLFLMVIF